MMTLRVFVLSVVLMLVLAGAIYFAVSASPASSGQAAYVCPAITNVASLSTQELRDMLDARYERRVGLPR